MPPLDGRIVDNAHVLDRLSIDRITADLRAFEQRSSVQIAVITLPSLQGYPIEDWGLALLRGWHIGQQGKNNGVVVVIAPHDHKVRIETGYGAEGPLPDAEASLIIRRDMIPAFKQGDYAGGLQSGLRSIETDLAADFTPVVEATPTPAPAEVEANPIVSMPETHTSVDAKTILIIICIPFAFMGLAIFLAIAFRGSGQRIWAATNGNRYRDDDPFWSNMSGNDSSSGFSFGSSSSSDSFSGGGGSGGGGGASGSW